MQKYAEIAYSHKSDMVRFFWGGGWIAQPLFSTFLLIAKLWIRCCAIYRWHMLSSSETNSGNYGTSATTDSLLCATIAIRYCYWRRQTKSSNARKSCRHSRARYANAVRAECRRRHEARRRAATCRWSDRLSGTHRSHYWDPSKKEARSPVICH